MASDMTQGQKDLFGNAEFGNDEFRQIPQTPLRNSQISLSRNEFRTRSGNSFSLSREFPQAEFISTGNGEIADELERTKLKLERARQAQAGLLREQVELNAQMIPYNDEQRLVVEGWKALLEEEGGFKLSQRQREFMRSGTASLDEMRVRFRPILIEKGRLKSAITIIKAEVRSLESDMKFLVGKINRRRK
jgi:hypothetical protein